MRQIDNEEILKISASLEDYHSMFYVFWDMCGVFFADNISTAAVGFTNVKPILLLNEEFWARHNHREQLFIICHECLHVLLDHGIRNGKNIPGSTPDLVNIAQDITINHIITSLFGFNRNELREWSKYCWIDTCFDNPISIRHNQNFEYYLTKLIEQHNPDKKYPDLFDEHQDSVDDNNTQSQTVKTIAKTLNPVELDAIIKSLPKAPDENNKARTLNGMLEGLFNEKVSPIKIKFDKIIKKLKRTRLKQKEQSKDSFVNESRRFNDVARYGLDLPGVHVHNGKIKDKLLTVLFMDISGSCVHNIPKFRQVEKAFSDQPDIFDLRSFVFDTTVKEIQLNSNIVAGGGTKFDIIEHKILELESEYNHYPDCVIVITDGEGTPVTPKIPSRWIWLLIKPANKTYINKQSKHFLLSDVEFL